MLNSGKKLAEHKLILLYIIDNFESSLSNVEIMKIVLENKFMDYFVFQEILSELCSNGLVETQNCNNKTYYSVTPHGKKSLSFFGSVVPVGIMHRIDTLVNMQKEDKKLDSFIFADFEKSSDDNYNISCRVSHDSKYLIDLKLTSADINTASSICYNWKKYFQEIYPEIIEILTQKR